jgi:hypothetical protein
MWSWFSSEVNATGVIGVFKLVGHTALGTDTGLDIASFKADLESVKVVIATVGVVGEE